MQILFYFLGSLTLIYEMFIFNQETIVYVTFITLFLILVSIISTPLTNYFETLKNAYIQQLQTNFHDRGKLLEDAKIRLRIKKYTPIKDTMGVQALSGSCA